MKISPHFNNTPPHPSPSHFSQFLHKVLRPLQLASPHSSTHREEAQNSHEEDFRNFIESLDDLFWEIDRRAVVVYVSPKVYDLLGYRPEEVIGKHMSELGILEEYESIAAMFESTAQPQEGGVKLVESTFFHKADGHKIFLESSVIPILSPRGEILGYRGVIRDISNRKKAEWQLAQTAFELDAVINAIPDLYFRFNRQGTIIDVKFHSIDPFKSMSYLKGKRLKELLTQDRYTPLLEAFERARDSRVIQVYETAYTSATEREYFWEVRFIPLLADEVIAFVRDISERKQIDNDRKKREAILKTISTVSALFIRTGWEECLPQAFLQLGQATGVSQINLYENHYLIDHDCCATRIYSWTAPEAPLETTCPPPNSLDLYTPALCPFCNALKDGQEIVATAQSSPDPVQELLKKYGVKSALVLPIFVGSSWWGFLDLNDCLVEREWSMAERETLKIAADILGAAIQRKQIEDALQSAEIKFRDLVEQALAGIYLIDAQGKYLYVNPRLAEIAGYSQEEFLHLSKDNDVIIPPETRDQITRYFQQEDPQPPLKIHYTTHTQRKDGSSIYIEVQGAEIASDSDPVVIGTVLDITESTLREQEMQAVIEVFSAMRSANTRSEVVSEILNQVIEQVHANGALWIAYQAEKKKLLIEQAHGIWASMSGVELNFRESISASIIKTGQPYCNRDVRSDPRAIPSEAHAAMAVPIVAQEQTLGVLWAERTTPFAENELRLLMAIGDMAANSLQRVRLYEQTELRLRRLTALRAIDMAITSSLDLRVTLNMLLSQITSLMKIDAAGVLLLNPTTQTLEYTAIRGFHGNALQHAQQRLGEGHAGQVVLNRQAVSVPDIRQDSTCACKEILEGEGFSAYYAAPLIAKGQVKGVLELFQRTPLEIDPEWTDYIQAIAAQAAIAIDNAELFDKLQRSNIDLTLAYDETISGWARAVELRTQTTSSHIQNVVDLTLQLARASGIAEANLVHVRRGVLLHDIGELVIPDSILFKAGPLTPEEWDVLRKHPQYAFDLLSPLSNLRQAIDIPYNHHEKWDGSGYPRGLSGVQIPLAARVFAIVDVWDALQSERPYRAAWSRDQAQEYIRSQAGIHFDPQLVPLFLDQMEHTSS